MELVLAFLGFVAVLIKAVTVITTTAITERAKTQRAVIESGSSPERISTSSTPYTPSESTPIRNDARIGGFALLVSLSQLAFMQFAAVADAPLTVGAVAHVAQALGLFGFSVALLLRR